MIIIVRTEDAAVKKTLSVILAVLIVLSCGCFFSFTAFTDDEFTVTVGSEAETADTLNAVRWFRAENGEYFFFIPSYWDASSLTVWTSAPAQINGMNFESGTVTDLGEKGTIRSGGTDYKYNVVASSGVGTVFIATESGSLEAVHADKSHKEPGEISIKNEKGKEQTETSVLSYIKGRGNASWNGSKKPYNIKLDKKAKVLGMAKSKKWCLIANEGDRSLMRNAIVYNAAADAGLAYSPECAPVDLYVNSEYIGAYLLTSKIEADGNRIDVEDLDELNEEICLAEYGGDFDMDTIGQGGVYGRFSGLLEGTNKYADIPGDGDTANGGYVLEMEIANRYPEEKSGFVTKTGQPFIMKSPEFASKKQIDFISGYYQRFEDAAFSQDGKNSGGESYGELIDTVSFAKYYDISEWTSNMDTGLTSTYFYLDTTKDGKLYAGPVWDYDIALGNNGGGRFGLDYTNPGLFTVCHSRQYRNTIFGTYDADEKPGIFNVLCKKQDFVDECKAQWDESVYAAVSAWSSDKFDGYAQSIKASAVMNHIRRNTYGTADIEKVAEKYASDVGGLKSFASERAEYMNGNIGKIQENPVKTSFALSMVKKVLTGINNLFERIILRFNLENK